MKISNNVSVEEIVYDIKPDKGNIQIVFTGIVQVSA